MGLLNLSELSNQYMYVKFLSFDLIVLVFLVEDTLFKFFFSFFKLIKYTKIQFIRLRMTRRCHHVVSHSLTILAPFVYAQYDITVVSTLSFYTMKRFYLASFNTQLPLESIHMINYCLS